MFGRRVGPALFSRPQSRLFNPAHVAKAQGFFHMDDVWAGILLIGISAVVMDRLVQLAMARAVRWQERVVR